MMKYLLCGVAAIAVLSACDRSGSVDPAEAPLGEVSVRKGDPAEASAVLAAMSLTNSGDGMIEYASKDIDGDTATFNNLVASGEEGGFTADSLVFEGLDMIDGKAAFGKMSLNNILAEPDEDHGTFGIGKIELVNPTPELAAWFSASLGQSEPAPFPSADKLGFDAWAIDEIAADIDSDDGQGKFNIDKLEIRDLKDQKAARALIKSVNFEFVDAEDGTPVNMSLDSFGVSGVDASFLEAVQNNMGDQEAMMQAIMDKAYSDPMDPGYDRMTMDNLSIAAAGATFKMPSLDASVERNAEGQPVKFVTKPFSMMLDADPDGGEAGAGLAQGLSMIGYESIELKAASVSDYDPETDTVNFKANDNYLELVDGAKFSFGGEFSGYSAYAKEIGSSMNFEALAEGQEPDPMAFQAALGELEVANFEMKIKDDSLVDRIFNAIAAQQGQDPEQLRTQTAQMMGMAPMMAQGSGVDMKLVTELSSAVSSFISKPKTLTIKLAPEEPLSMGTVTSMEDPSLLTKDYLGFSAENK